METKEKINPFNNSVEAGLRILTILNEAFPKSLDLQNLVYLDYLTKNCAKKQVKKALFIH